MKLSFPNLSEIANRRIGISFKLTVCFYSLVVGMSMIFGVSFEDANKIVLALVLSLLWMSVVVGVVIYAKRQIDRW